MALHSRIVAIALLSPMAPLCTAGELQRLAVDFEGSGRTEIVRLTTSPASLEWRRSFSVQIGDAKFSGEYFSAEGDSPQVRVIAPDSVRKHRLLLVDTAEPGGCSYYLLRYTHRKLTPLLTLENKKECRPPLPIGNGRFQVTTWQGFWERDDIYQPSNDDQVLRPVLSPFYLLRAGGAAAAGLTLGGAECKVTGVAENTFVSITRFDPAQDRYRVESANGACGWIPAKLLPERVKELPWAD